MAETAKTFLMFQGEAAEALDFYRATFASVALGEITYWREGQGPVDQIQRAELTIGGHALVLMDSPVQHAFGFTPAISLWLDVESEEVLERYVAALLEGGKTLMPLDTYGFSRRFAWVEDGYGVSWQLNLP